MARKAQTKPRKGDKKLEKVKQWGYIPKAQKVRKHGPSKGPKRENAHKGQEIEHIGSPQDTSNVGEAATVG